MNTTSLAELEIASAAEQQDKIPLAELEIASAAELPRNDLY